MPCLNEAETLETCIRKASRFLAENKLNGEIVIGDNGSTDGSQAIAERCGARVIAVPLRGYGAALYYATLGCRGRYAIMGDSDDSYDFTNLMPFVEKLREGYDLVMGNRFLGGIRGAQCRGKTGTSETRFSARSVVSFSTAPQRIFIAGCVDIQSRRSGRWTCRPRGWNTHRKWSSSPHCWD